MPAARGARLVMARSAVADRTRLALFLAGRSLSAGSGRLLDLSSLPSRIATPTSDRLLIAPQDLRTTDPTRAAEIYSGRYTFAGKTLDGLGRSPFSVPAPSPEWRDALHGFGWLRHLRAADSALARSHARVLVDEWISLGGGPDAGAWTPEIVGRRVISWLCQSPLILDGADRAFYRRFLRSLCRQVRYLKRRLPATRPGLPRLTVLAALSFAGLCLAGQTGLQRFASRRLGEEIEAQVLPDGGHVSRNPDALVALLLDFLPLRQAYAAQNAAPPVPLLNGIDRMMPMIRFFRHADGNFALFNGMGPTPIDTIATVLAYDDARGAPVLNAQHSGYQRLEAGRTVVIADTGAPPPLPLSGEAHAGCLSFELSSRANRIVVNCGLPVFNREGWRSVARSTAAHSTLVFEDTSSCRMVASARLKRVVGAPIVSGPTAVPVERADRDEGVAVRASHDGYVARFGIVHSRSLLLAIDGTRLHGQDRLSLAQGRQLRGSGEYVLRFHLHPSVRASKVQDGRGVLLVLPNREAWLFTANELPIEIEESIFLAGADGPRRAEQMVVRGVFRERPETSWLFQRTEAPGGRRPRDEEEWAELPL